MCLHAKGLFVRLSFSEHLRVCLCLDVCIDINVCVCQLWNLSSKLSVYFFLTIKERNHFGHRTEYLCMFSKCSLLPSSTHIKYAACIFRAVIISRPSAHFSYGQAISISIMSCSLTTVLGLCFLEDIQISSPEHSVVIAV